MTGAPRVQVVRLSLAVAFVVSLTTDATAHVGALEARTPFVTAGEFVGGGTTWGITLAEGEQLLRTCDEATDGVTQFQTRMPSGTILISSTAGLFATTLGCTSRRLTSVGATETANLFAQPSGDQATIFIATSEPDGPARIYRSNDDGESFALEFEQAGATLLSLATDAPGTTIVAAGFLADLTPMVWASVDGAAFASLPAFDDTVRFLNVIGTDDVEVEGRFALSLIDAEANSTVVLIDVAAALAATPETLAATYSELAAFDGNATHYASTATGRAVLVDRRQYWSQIGDGVFKAEETGPVRCLTKFPGEDRMAGCGTDESGDAFGSSTDGRVWTWSMPFESIEDRLCPSGTVGRVRCAYIFPGLDAGPLPVEDAGEADAGEIPSDAGVIVDAGEIEDAGAVDAGERVDGGAPEPEPVDGGTPPVPPVCACDVASDEEVPAAFAFATVLAFTAVALRRVRKRRRASA